MTIRFLPTSKVLVCVETITKSLVWQIYHICQVLRLHSEAFWSYFIHKTLQVWKNVSFDSLCWWHWCNRLYLLTETGMLGCCLADTPIEPYAKLRDTCDQVSIDKEKYQCLVENFIYLSHTRPNISYVVSIVSQFMQTLLTKNTWRQYTKFWGT